MPKFPVWLLSFLSVFAVVLVLLANSVHPTAAQSAEDHVPGQVLVKFKDSTPPGVINAELKRHHGDVVTQIEGIGTFVINVPEAALGKVITALSRNPNVEYAEENTISTVMAFPDDPSFTGNQWGLENTGQTIAGQGGTVDADIDTSAAWIKSTGTASAGAVKVAVLDTGIDTGHPDISSKVVLAKDFTGSGSTNDFYGHGTHVSGIVAAVTNNSTGVAGVCPDCIVLNGKVLNDSGSGANSWIASGITWATDNGAKVINMSLGSSVKSTTLERAVNYAWNRGVVVVAAAGNSANPSKTYPGAYGNVIAVAATDNRDKKASFSSYGNWVDVAAPGVNIYSTFPTHAYVINKSLNYDFGSGTSMATPMVSGTAALIWASPYGTSASAVRNRLQNTADRIVGTGSYWSAGRINAGAAVN
jgi:thermitase